MTLNVKMRLQNKFIPGMTIPALLVFLVMVSFPLHAAPANGRVEGGEIIFAPQPRQKVPERYVRAFSSFKDARIEFLNLMGLGQKRIWLATDFLSDGEIVAALYLAKYRNVDVQVILGRGRMNHPMSRASTLRRQGIPVYGRPSSFPFKSQTALMIDNELYVLDHDLDYRSARPYLTLKGQRPHDITQYQESFAAVIQQPVPTQPVPAPDVYRPSEQAPEPPPVREPVAGAKNRPKNTRPDYTGSPDGVYNYNYSKSNRSWKAPEGAVRRLPKSTVFELKQKQKVEEALKQKSGQFEQPQTLTRDPQAPLTLPPSSPAGETQERDHP